MKSVLVIDDDDLILRFLKRLLRKDRNVIFEECHNMEQAMHAIERHKPEIVLLDHSLTMGGEEGIRVVDELSARNMLAKIKIYSTTTNIVVWEEEYKKRGIEHVEKSDYMKIGEIVRS